MPLADLVGPGVAARPRGAPVNAAAGLHPRDPRADPHRETAEARASSTRPEGRMLREGETFRFPELADALERSAPEGPEPSTAASRGGARRLVIERGRHPRPRRPRRLRGDRARARPRAVPRHRGPHQPAAVLGRDPDRLRLGLLERLGERSGSEQLVAAMERGQRGARRGVRRRALRAASGASATGRASSRRRRCAPSRAGPGPARLDHPHHGRSTATGGCASVTCSNGSGSGVLVPGTGRPRSTTCSARRTSTRSASTRSRRAGGCRR